MNGQPSFPACALLSAAAHWAVTPPSGIETRSAQVVTTMRERTESLTALRVRVRREEALSNCPESTTESYTAAIILICRTLCHLYVTWDTADFRGSYHQGASPTLISSSQLRNCLLSSTGTQCVAAKETGPVNRFAGCPACGPL